MSYRFEEVQNLKFMVYDVYNHEHLEHLSRQDLIGQIQCSLADIVTAGQQYYGKLENQGGLMWTHYRLLVVPQKLV